MRLPSPLAMTAALSAFLCGLLAPRSSLFSVADAHAQSSALASTIYVPSDGLAFRTFDGHVIAKISYDSHGGVLELYDEHERPATSFRTSGALLKGGGAPAPAATTTDATIPRTDLGF